MTRPQPGAARTARRLAGRGIVAIELPLTEIVAVPVNVEVVRQLGVGFGEMAKSPAFQGMTEIAVAATSANALRHAPKELLAALSGLPCFAVGGETAAQAREAGFSDVREGPGTADALAELLIGEPRPRNVLLLCGRVRLSGFERRLAEAGITVQALETYDTLPIGYAPEALSAALGKEPIDAVLLYSAGAAENFLGLHWQADGMFARTKFLCLSARVADRLVPLDDSRILVAAEPTEDALLALL